MGPQRFIIVLTKARREILPWTNWILQTSREKQPSAHHTRPSARKSEISIGRISVKFHTLPSRIYRTSTFGIFTLRDHTCEFNLFDFQWLVISRATQVAQASTANTRAYSVFLSY
jgi:hypothetical protein